MATIAVRRVNGGPGLTGWFMRRKQEGAPAPTTLLPVAMAPDLDDEPIVTFAPRRTPRAELLPDPEVIAAEIRRRIADLPPTEQPSAALHSSIDITLDKLRADPTDATVWGEATGLLTMLRADWRSPEEWEPQPLTGHDRWQAQKTLEVARAAGDVEAVGYVTAALAIGQATVGTGTQIEPLAA